MEAQIPIVKKSSHFWKKGLKIGLVLAVIVFLGTVIYGSVRIYYSGGGEGLGYHNIFEALVLSWLGSAIIMVDVLAIVILSTFIGGILDLTRFLEHNYKKS